MDSPKVSSLNHVCLFLLGFSVYCPVLFFISASPDILAGTTIGTSAISLAEGIPGILTNIFGNWFISRLSLLTSLVIGTVSCVASLLLLILGGDAYVRLLAVAGVNFAAQWMAVWCMGLTAHLRDDGRLISGYETGISLSGIIGVLSYTALTTWLCVSPQVAMTTCLVFPILSAIIYAALDKTAINENVKHSDEYTELATCEQHEEAPNKSQGKDSVSSDQSIGQDKTPGFNSDDYCKDSKLEKDPEESLLLICWKVFPRFTYCYIAATSLKLSRLAILTTIVTPSSYIAPRDHYMYYSLAIIIPRSVVGLIYSAYSHFFPTNRVLEFCNIWLISTVCLAHMMFFVFVSWYHFLPGLSVTLMFCVSFGFAEGCMWVFGFIGIKDMFSNVRDAGYGLSIVNSARQFANLVAGLQGVNLERMLLRHCKEELLLGDNCLARSIFVRGWEQLHCSKH
ncbi:uncharacterized protein LOC5518595 [Nematostella vectensis]|uniref:uncharacterized protein LOC5518595 n=1 Tax=Nematostella vectensis TaxID=45351 RepID=UPI0020770320|nr:uncharacterized protein LOC5518595 [Nematostella vectensis]